jgi:hypothetical protein
VDLHDSGSGFLGRAREFDLSVKTAGTEQSRIQNVDTIRRGNDLNKAELQFNLLQHKT